MRVMRLCLILALLGIACDSQAEESFGALRGTVRDASNGETLPNANVAVDSLKIGAATNKTGYYIIGHLPTGKHTVVFSYMGYQSQSIAVAVVPGQTVQRDVELTPVVLEGQDVEAVGKRVAPTDISSVSTFGTRVTELARIPTVGQPDLMRGIQLLPGVQASGDNSAGIYVRGGTPGQNLILLDDVVVYNPSHLFGFFSTFNPDALKDVTLLKGTFPARYGDRLSSVLDITNLDGNSKAFDARASLDLISAGLTAEGPLGDRGSWMISGRRTYQELLNSPLFNHIVDDMFSTRMGTLSAAPGAGTGRFGRFGGFGGFGGGRFGGGRFNFGQTTSSFGQNYGFYDTNFKANLEASDRDKVSASGYLGNDALDLSLPSFGNTTRDQVMNWGNQVGRLRWTHLFTDKLMGDVQASISRYVSNFNVASSQDQGQGQVTGGRGFAQNRDNALRDLTFKMDLDYYMGPRNTLRMGAQMTSYSAFYRQGIGDSSRSQIDAKSLYETGYLEQSLRIGRLELTPGVRVSHFQSGNYTNWSPRVSGLFQLDDRIGFKGGWGIYHQYLNLISIESASYSTDMWLPVDETLKPGRAVHSAFGVVLTPADAWTVDVELYNKDLRNIVEFQSQVRLTPDTPLSNLFVSGTGRSYGAELMLRKSEGNTTGWIGYTLSKTEETIPELNNGAPFPPKYDRRHDVSVVLNRYLGHGWNVNLNWVYGTGQAYTLPEGYYQVVQPSGQVISYLQVSEKNAYRLPAYHRMDLGITRDFSLLSAHGQVVFSVFNVYDRHNVWYRTFDTTGSEVQVQDVLLQPILPSVGIKFKL